MAVLASKGTASVTLAIGETLNVLAGGQGVAVLKGGASKGQSVELGASVRKIGPFPFAMPITINSQSGALTYYVGADSAAPHVEIAGEYDAASGQTVLDDASRGVFDAGLYKRAPKLNKLFAGIARVLSGQGQCFIGLIDDSTGVGGGAGTGAKGLLNARPGSPTAHFASLLNASGIPAADDSWFGEHLIEAFQGVTRAQYDTRFTVSGSAAYYTDGTFQTVGGIPFRLNSAGKAVNFTPTYQTDTAKFFYFNSLGGTVDCSFAGGASLGTVVASGASTIGSSVKTYTKGAGAFSVSWVSGNSAIVGVICYDSTTPRVNVINLGSYGDKLTSTNGYANNPNYWRGGAALSVLALDAVIVGMTINSENQDGLAGVAAYRVALEKVCSDVVASGADLILSTPHNIGTAAQSTGICDAYVETIRAVAAQYNAPVIDLYRRIDDYSAFNALGLYFDSLHLTTIGYRAKAQEFARVLNVWA